ncbi:hypothetical protein CDD83_3130 [Cordyceps sp. RAO-2017]|nr:hypothetical protein CDD83_3130 [Cordyceps sp. RAO-2017]
MAVAGTTHDSFTDRPALLAALGRRLPDAARAALRKSVGTIDPHRLERVLAGLLTAFFDLALYGERGRVADLGRTFPEVSVVRERL